MENPSDDSAKNTITKSITDFLRKMTDITHGDVNTQFSSVLKSLNIKPNEFKDPKVPATAAPKTTPPGQSSILQKSGNPF